MYKHCIAFGRLHDILIKFSSSCFTLFFLFFSKEYYNVDLSAAPTQNILKKETQVSAEAEEEVEEVEEEEDEEEEGDHVLTRAESKKKEEKIERKRKKSESKSEM